MSLYIVRARASTDHDVRVLKSQAQKLEEQVKALTARNRDLESALSRSQLMSRSSSFSEIDCHSELIADEDGSGSESIAAQVGLVKIVMYARYWKAHSS